jgi:5'-phosphate synthase pdxT subunit
MSGRLSGPTIGVLALQGDVREHAAMLTALGARVVPVRRPAELAQIDGLVLPGGESTTMDKLLRAFDLHGPLKVAIHGGLPVLGSCAGMILMAHDILDGIDGQQTLDAIPMTVRRNAFGRQVDSSEVDLTWVPDASPMHATFIRAPWVEDHSPEVEVLATADAHGDRIVAVKYRDCVATAFHPEISGDTRVHQLFLDVVTARA